MMLAMRMGGCNILIPNPRDMPAVLKELSKREVPQLPGGQHAVQRAGQPPGLRHGRLERPEDLASAAAWRCRAPPPSCGSRRPAARSSRATACRRPRPSATCNPVDSTAYSGNIGLPMPNTEIEAARRRRQRGAAGQAGRDRDHGPAGDGRLLAAPRRDRQGDDRRRLLPQRRHRRGRRARLLQDRRPQEGHDPGQRLQRLPERGRGRGHADARRARMRRGRRARREGRRGGEAGDRQEGPGARPKPTVRAYCEANLTGYKRPKVVEFRTDLPKTPVGKILRRELRDVPK